MALSKRSALATVSLGVLVGLTALNATVSAQEAKPHSAAQASENSGTMERADKDMRRVLTELQKLGAKPLGSQSVEETRKGPTPADAVKAVLKADGKDPMALMAPCR